MFVAPVTGWLSLPGATSSGTFVPEVAWVFSLD